MASGVDGAGAGATENRIDQPLERCRFFRQSDHGRTARSRSPFFPPSYPPILGIAGINILCLAGLSNRRRGIVFARAGRSQKTSRNTG
jgi:hypothetical protein